MANSLNSSSTLCQSISWSGPSKKPSSVTIMNKNTFLMFILLVLLSVRFRSSSKNSLVLRTHFWYTLLVSQLVLLWRGRCGEAQERGAEHGRTDGKESRDEKCNLVAAVEGGEMIETCTHQAVRVSGGEAGKDGETERTAHHERGVDDT